MKQSRLLIATIVVAVLLFQACSKEQPGSTTAVAPAATNAETVQITNNGQDITFAPNAPQLAQFTLDTVRESSLRLTLTAPVHNLVNVITSEVGTKKLYLFETQDLTDTYSNYVTSVANLEHSSLALAREKDLYAHEIASAKDVQDAEQDYATQQASLADNDAKLRAAGIDPKALGQTAAGTIWVIADLPEGEVASIKPGMKAELQYETYPGKTFTGQLTSIGQAIDPNTRKVKVQITVANPGNMLHPAMFGTAAFIGSSQRAMTVPTTAVIREGDGTMSAWVTPDGHHFTRRTVTIGLQQDGIYQITDGLQPGDILVTSGGIFLSNMNESIDLPDREEKK